MVERTIVNPAAVGSRQHRAQLLDSSETRWLLIAIAALVSSSDLIVKLVTPTESGLFHQRTHLALMGMLLISALSVYVIPLARSRSIAIGGGLMVGGGVGNALSIAIFPLGVPNPMVISTDGWIIAFNLADVCVGIGLVLMIAGVCGLAIDHRQELRETVER